MAAAPRLSGCQPKEVSAFPARKSAEDVQAPRGLTRKPQVSGVARQVGISIPSGRGSEAPRSRLAERARRTLKDARRVVGGDDVRNVPCPKQPEQKDAPGKESDPSTGRTWVHQFLECKAMPEMRQLNCKPRSR